VCQIIEDLESYLKLQRQVTDDEMCRVYLKRIQHLYYKVGQSVFVNDRLILDMKVVEFDNAVAVLL